MTNRSIKDQVQTIKAATVKASSSKAAAIAFLRDVGIIENAPKQVGKRKKRDVEVAANEWTVVEASKEGRISIFPQGSFVKEPVIEGSYVTRRGAAKAVAASAKNTASKRSPKK